MQNCADKLCFEFGNSADKLVSSLQYMLDHIAGNIPARADAEDIMFRSKVIITELLTNGIKHAGNSSTLFDIETYSDSLLIRKTDNGLPLYLVNSHKHSGAQNEDNKKLISADFLNSLYAIWESDNHIRFASEEVSFDDMPVEQVMEHFGILIITRSADEFTYTYHKESGFNIFTVKLLF